MSMRPPSTNQRAPARRRRPDVAGAATGPLPAVRVARVVPRKLVAAVLAVSGYVHANLAPPFNSVGAPVTQGNLFQIGAAAASLAAPAVLAVGRRAGFGLAFVVAASSLGAILVYLHVAVGQLGPLPDMREPAWFAGLSVAAVAGAAAMVLAAGGLVWEVRKRWNWG
jgi:hypothetical protein